MDGQRFGPGSIGGKGEGFERARRTLASISPRPERIRLPETVYIGSGVFEDFLDQNDLTVRVLNSPPEDLEQFKALRREFKVGAFPQRWLPDMEAILERYRYPLAVRSSSLLEDRPGTSFAGAYETLFISNQGSKQERMAQLIGAIRRVYASTYGPHPVAYRRRHGFHDSEERMGLMIQQAVGTPYGDYFMPLFAGVGFSQNGYCWHDAINKDDGVARLVFGLGTRAVGRGYARIVSPGKPLARPEGNRTNDIARFSQAQADVLELSTNKLRSVPFSALVRSGTDCFPGAERLFSLRDGAFLYQPVSKVWNPQHIPVLTFHKLLSSPNWGLNLPKTLLDLFRPLENAFGCPVDMEFAARLEDGELWFYILQARPLSQRRVLKPQPIPDVPQEDVILRATRSVPSGRVRSLEYLVSVDAATYARWPLEQRHEVARVVGALNSALDSKRYALLGPGRWGSVNPQLGVPVRYQEINHCRLLVEVAWSSEGFVPEVSYGTHFFQDLIEDGIIYIPLFPEEEGAFLHTELFRETNSLASLLPDPYYRSFDTLIRVIHLPTVCGAKAQAALNGEREEALVYVKR